MSTFYAFIMALLFSAVSTHAITITANAFKPPHRPINVFDGSTETRWSCSGECSLVIDFTQLWMIDGLWIHWLSAESRTAIFDIQLSNDNKYWQTVYSEGSNLSPDWEFYHFTRHQARYLRILGHGNSENAWNSINEIYPEFPYGFPDSWQLRTVEKIIASSYNKSNTPDKAFDGLLSTFWTADSPAWIQFDMGYDTTIEEIKIAWHNGDKRISQFDVQISGDGIEWFTVFVGESSGKTANLETYLLDQEYSCRFVRIVAMGNNHPTQFNKNSISEMEFWGYQIYFGNDEAKSYSRLW